MILFHGLNLHWRVSFKFKFKALFDQKKIFSGKVITVKATSRLEEHPCVVTVEEMGAAR